MLSIANNPVVEIFVFPLFFMNLFYCSYFGKKSNQSPGATVNIHSPKKALCSSYLLANKYSPVFFSQDKKTPGSVYLPVNKYCLGKYLLPFSYSATSLWTPLSFFERNKG